MEIRAAVPADAPDISQVLKDLVAAGQRRKPSDPAFVTAHYLEHPGLIRCSLAIDDRGTVLGFQSLKRAAADNPYGTPPGWGIVGTHILPSSARRGVGRALFAATLGVARRTGLPAIEAFIGADTAAAIAYYEALGFVTYRSVEGVDCKCLRLS